MWTEIIAEDVAVLHAYGCDVLLEISGSVSELEVLEAKRELEKQRAVERMREQNRQLRRQMAERQTARERLRGAGYSSDDIPL